MSTCILNEAWWKISKEDEYKKNKNLKPSVSIIQDWIKKQPHLPSLNAHQIIMFLRVWDNSLEKTKTSIDLNYTMRTRYPEFFSERTLQRTTMENTMQYIRITTLSNHVDDTIVVVCALTDVDLTKFSVEEGIKLFFMYHDMTHLEYGSSNGYIYIVDLKFVTLSLLLRLPIATIGSILKFLQESSTYRMKEVHFINGGSAFKRLLQMFQQFLNSEILELIYLHDNYESLQNVVNKSFIPSDYGGEASSLEELSSDSLATLKKYKDWFIEEETQKIVEKKKSNSKINKYELQGSFRKLNLD